MRTDGPARALLAAGAEALLEAAFRTGDYPPAQAGLEAARDRAVSDGDRATEAAAIDRLGMLMHFQALDAGRQGVDPAAELALFERALAIREEIGDPAGTAESLFGVGLVHQVLRRDWATAMPYFRRAVELADRHAGELLRSEVHRHLGFYHLVEEVDPDRARHELRLSLELRERHGDPRWISSGLLALGQAELVAGARDEALGHLRRAVEQAREAGLKPQWAGRCEEWLRRAESGEPVTLR